MSEYIIVLANRSTQNANSQSQSASLEALVAEIQTTPPNPAMIEPAQAPLLAFMEAYPPTPDSDFDIEAWNQDWDKVEKELAQLDPYPVEFAES